MVTMSRTTTVRPTCFPVIPTSRRFEANPAKYVPAYNGYCAFGVVRVIEAVEKKQRIIAILREHGNYRWLTSSGPVTILNNGIEFAITYFLMLLSLFFTGGGRYISIDYWLTRKAS